MNAVLKQLKDEDQAKLEADQRRYADLLENDKPTPPEVDELRDLIKRLGKTHDQVQLDHRIITDAIAAESRIKEGTSLDESIHAAERAVRAYQEETERVKVERAKELNRLGLHSSNLQSTRGAAQDSYYNLEKMRHIHLDLLKHRKVLPKP